MRTGDWVKLFRSYGVGDLQRELYDVIYVDSELFSNLQTILVGFPGCTVPYT